MRLFVLALVAAAAGALAYSPRGGDAQNCSNGPFVRTPGRVVSTPYVPTHVTHHETHHDAVAIDVPVFVPVTVFQYMPALSPAVQTTALTVQAQAAPAVARAPAAAQSLAAAPPAGSQADIDAVIRARVDAILRERTTGISADEPPPVDAAEPVAAAAPAEDQQTKALSLMVTHCNACHGDAKQDGGVQLFRTLNGQLTFKPTLDGQPMDLDTVARSVSTGKMPRLRGSIGNRALTPAEKQDLLAWLVRR